MANSVEYLLWLRWMEQLHKDKSSGYDGDDKERTFHNLRSAEELGVPAYVGAAIRLSDKFNRMQNIIRAPANETIGESLLDTLSDLAAYAGIVRVLYKEWAQDQYHRIKADPNATKDQYDYADKLHRMVVLDNEMLDNSDA